MSLLCHFSFVLFSLVHGGICTVLFLVLEHRAMVVMYSGCLLLYINPHKFLMTLPWLTAQLFSSFLLIQKCHFTEVPLKTMFSTVHVKRTLPQFGQSLPQISTLVLSLLLHEFLSLCITAVYYNFFCTAYPTSATASLFVESHFK